MAAVDLAAGQVSFLLIGRYQSCSIQSAHIAVSRAPWFCRTCPRRPADRAAVQRSSRRRHMQQRTLLRHRFLCRAMAAPTSAFDIPAAPILIPKGPWKEVDGCVCAPKGFKAQGMAGGLRAAGPKADIGLVAADEPCVAAGVFTLNVMCAAPVTYCKQVLAKGQPVKAVLINAGQANAATGDQGYQDCLTSAKAVAEALGCQPEQVLLESTGLIDRCIKMHPVNQAVCGVIGRRIKMEALVDAVPKLASRLGSNVEDAHHAAVAITTTDLVSKSAALEVKIGGVPVRVGGFAKGSGMIHPNMATMLAIITTDASVDPGLWRTMLQHGTAKSFNQITVDGDTSTNDAVLGLASGAAGGKSIKHANSEEAQQLEAAVTALLQGLAKSVAWDGEGATCLMEVSTGGAPDDKAALTIAKSIAGSSLVKAAVFGHDPNWGRIACAAGYSGVKFNQNDMRVKLGDIVLMDKGQPLEFDKSAASGYLKTVTSKHGTVYIDVQVGSGGGHGTAWGCDLSYDYVKINAEYTT